VGRAAVTATDQDMLLSLPQVQGTRGRFPSPEQMTADAALYARHRFEGCAVAVEAFAVAVVIDADEPVPYYLSAQAERLLAGAVP